MSNIKMGYPALHLADTKTSNDAIVGARIAALAKIVAGKVPWKKSFLKKYMCSTVSGVCFYKVEYVIVFPISIQ